MGRRLLRSGGGSEATLGGVFRPHVNPADGRQYQRGGLDALLAASVFLRDEGGDTGNL